jgi:hypothetical protein
MLEGRLLYFGQLRHHLYTDGISPHENIHAERHERVPILAGYRIRGTL